MHQFTVIGETPSPCIRYSEICALICFIEQPGGNLNRQAICVRETCVLDIEFVQKYICVWDKAGNFIISSSDCIRAWKERNTLPFRKSGHVEGA